MNLRCALGPLEGGHAVSQCQHIDLCGRAAVSGCTGQGDMVAGHLIARPGHEGEAIRQAGALGQGLIERLRHGQPCQPVAGGQGSGIIAEHHARQRLPWPSRLGPSGGGGPLTIHHMQTSGRLEAREGLRAVCVGLKQCCAQTIGEQTPNGILPAIGHTQGRPQPTHLAPGLLREPRVELFIGLELPQQITLGMPLRGRCILCRPGLRPGLLGSLVGQGCCVERRLMADHRRSSLLSKGLCLALLRKNGGQGGRVETLHGGPLLLQAFELCLPVGLLPLKFLLPGIEGPRIGLGRRKRGPRLGEPALHRIELRLVWCKGHTRRLRLGIKPLTGRLTLSQGGLSLYNGLLNLLGLSQHALQREGQDLDGRHRLVSALHMAAVFCLLAGNVGVDFI